MTYDSSAPQGTIDAVSSQELWQRLADFLTAVVPAAEEAGVRLAAPPDDPPLPMLRGTPRMVDQPDLFQRLLEIFPSDYNPPRVCPRTISEKYTRCLHRALQQ